MHLAEGATPGTNSAMNDERLLQFSNSMTTAQLSQREQVPIHIPSSQAASAQPPHNLKTSSANSSGNPSLGPSKTPNHDSGAMSVRYKV